MQIHTGILDFFLQTAMCTIFSYFLWYFPSHYPIIHVLQRNLREEDSAGPI